MKSSLIAALGLPVKKCIPCNGEVLCVYPLKAHYPKLNGRAKVAVYSNKSMVKEDYRMNMHLNLTECCPQILMAELSQCVELKLNEGT